MKIRRAHIKAHISLYTKILKQLEQINKPYQAWVCIHDEDTGSDTVYIQTPNPNSDDSQRTMIFLNGIVSFPMPFLTLWIQLNSILDIILLLFHDITIQVNAVRQTLDILQLLLFIVGVELQNSVVFNVIRIEAHINPPVMQR